jgi:ParB family chromosome partitioning protein
VPEAGSCVDCPKRTGHNKLLFADMGTGQKDSCSDPKCYAAKLDAHIRQTIAAKPKLVQISTAYGQQKEGSTTLPRNKYVEVRQEKPKTKEEATRPEFKTCKYTTEAIVSEGIEKGELRKVCNGAAPSRACAVDSCRALWVELANGRRIAVNDGFDASTLERLIAVLEKA